MCLNLSERHCSVLLKSTVLGTRIVLVAQSCRTLCNPMDYSPPDSSVHGILQERILEWVAMWSQNV